MTNLIDFFQLPLLPLSLDTKKLVVCRTPISDPTSPNVGLPPFSRPDLDRRHSDSANYARLKSVAMGDQRELASGGRHGAACYQNTTIAMQGVAGGSGSTTGSEGGHSDIHRFVDI
jgi:hypothetical protein